jgi:hypothetical protein
MKKLPRIEPKVRRAGMITENFTGSKQLSTAKNQDCPLHGWWGFKMLAETTRQKAH